MSLRETSRRIPEVNLFWASFAHHFLSASFYGKLYEQTFLVGSSPVEMGVFVDGFAGAARGAVATTYNFCACVFSSTPGGTRTRNLRIRGPTPCPLGHGGMCCSRSVYVFLVGVVVLLVLFGARASALPAVYVTSLLSSVGRACAS